MQTFWRTKPKSDSSAIDCIVRLTIQIDRLLLLALVRVYAWCNQFGTRKKCQKHNRNWLNIGAYTRASANTTIRGRLFSAVLIALAALQYDTPQTVSIIIPLSCDNRSLCCECESSLLGSCCYRHSRRCKQKGTIERGGAAESGVIRRFQVDGNCKIEL